MVNAPTQSGLLKTSRMANRDTIPNSMARRRMVSLDTPNRAPNAELDSNRCRFKAIRICASVLLLFSLVQVSSFSVQVHYQHVS